MEFDDFEYMRWAKLHAADGQIQLTASGMPEWTVTALGLGKDSPTAWDLEPDDYDHPTRITAAVAAAFGVPEECVFVTASSSHATAIAFMALLEAGDDVLVETPNYGSMRSVASLANATVRTWPRRLEHGFALDADGLERHMRPNTRIVAVTNPHNPSGVLADPAHVEACSDVANRHGATLFMDEAYLGMAGPGLTGFVPGQNRVAVSSVTKAHGLGGLRLGWALADPPLIEKFVRLNDLFVVHPPFPSAGIAAWALEHPAVFQERLNAVRSANMPIVDRFMATREDLTCVRPEYGVLSFPCLNGMDDASPFVDRLLREHGVNVTPGRFFGRPDGFRIAVGRITPTVLTEALARIARCLDESPGA